LAGLQPSDINLIVAHATSTKAGDIVEGVAIDDLFGDHKVYITAPKSNAGHNMATIGGLHCIVALMAIQNQIAPPILNLKNPMKVKGKDLNFVSEPTKTEINHVICNAAGFGGINNSVIFSKYNSN